MRLKVKAEHSLNGQYQRIKVRKRFFDRDVNLDKTLDRTYLPTVVVAAPHDFSKVNADVKSAIDTARTTAETFASQELDKSKAEVIARVDDNFLDWYFDYFNQKKM